MFSSGTTSVQHKKDSRPRQWEPGTKTKTRYHKYKKYKYALLTRITSSELNISHLPVRDGLSCCNLVLPFCVWFVCAGSRRSRNRSRGQLIVKNSKATTLQFETDFDFETANAQFKDDLTKETVGMVKNISKFSFSEHGQQLLKCVQLRGFLSVADEKENSWEDTQDSWENTQDEVALKDKYYDKAKCFYDNISSDLKPRWICRVCCSDSTAFPECVVTNSDASRLLCPQEDHVGRREKVEHRDFRSSRTLPEGPRVQTQRPEHHWSENPPQNRQWEGVKAFFFGSVFCE